MASAGLLSIVMLAGIVTSACAAADQRAEGTAPAATSSTGSLVILTRGEPFSLALRAFRSAGGASYPHLSLNAGLDDLDTDATPFPVLAEQLPQLNTDTWRVFADGTMETRYQLRPNIVWHDGTAFDTADFVFAWQVYANPASGGSTLEPVGQMQEVLSPDPRTLVIRWRVLYPGAGALYNRNQGSFGALPRHILEQPYAGQDFEAFSNLPFWSQAYVGLGPYRLERWEPGVEIVATAFDQFVLGRPNIRRLRFLISNEATAALAALLSGHAHLALDYVLYYPEGAELREQWAETKRGTVLFSPRLYRAIVLQLRPDKVSTPALFDARFRQALAHATDKDAINEALLGGTAVVTHGQLSPQAPYYAAIGPSIVKYPHDLRRAQALLEEMGLQRGSDGFYLGLDRQPIPVDVMATYSPTADDETAIVVDGYRRLGLNATGRVRPTGLQGEARTMFGTMQIVGSSGFERGLGRMTSKSISRPENRWQGSNYGAWSNAQYDRLWEQYNSTLDRPTQIQLLAEMEKLRSEQLPEIPLYYTPLITPYVAGLTGPKLRTVGDTDTLTRIWEWRWRERNG